ncbi:hypothetical protein EV1_045036 [Malus domestica]
MLCLPPVKTRPDSNKVMEMKENQSDVFTETVELPVSQATGFAGNPRVQYMADPNYQGHMVRSLPVYYYPGQVPPTNVQVQPVPIRSQYVHQQYHQVASQIPVGYHNPIPGMGQVYGGGLRPVVAMDPYDVSARVVSYGGSQQQQLQQQVYYGVRNGAVVSPYNPDDWLLRDWMTKAPCVRFNSAKRAAELKFYLEEPNDYDTLSTVFNRSSRFGRLQTIKCAIVGKNLCMRFTCSTGDAMGMNMVSKGVQKRLGFPPERLP